MLGQERIHIGILIKNKMKERGMSVSDLARSLHYERTNIYKIFKRSSIDIELLIRISKILEYDFLQEVYLKNESSNLAFSESLVLIKIDKENAEVLHQLLHLLQKRD